VRRTAYILVALAAATTCASARAGDVALEVSTREAYVGEPITVQIQIINAGGHDAPQFPEIAGATVRGGRSGTNESMSWVNGRMTRQTTVTYSYTIIPRQPGTIQIPAIPVRVDGKVLSTAPALISVVASDMDDLDLAFLELAASRDSIYLGEALDVNLEVWVRPYRDRNVRLDAQDMLSRVQFSVSELGVFRETLVQLQNGLLRWQYREDVREDSEGTPRAYFVYLLPLADFVPTRTGPLDVGELNVVVSYPVRTDVERDLFGRPRRDFITGRPVYTVAKARPITVSLGESIITVKAVPTENRPRLFNGAVGRYDFAATASPTDVRVREPIDLTLTISGRGVLDRVGPPPLAQMEELTSGFRVPETSIAGSIQGDRKQFTVKIAAKHADVDEIPAIPFVYFDPQSEEYVTRWSDPIPIEVTASEEVLLAQYAEAENGTRTGATRLTQTAAGIRANYADMDEVLAQQAFAPGWGTAALLTASPLAFVACTLIRRHSDRVRYDRGYVRRRKACSTALAAIRTAARQADHANSASQIATAVIGYVADRCNAPGGLTRTEAVERLTQRGVGAKRVQAAEALLERCEGLQYAGTNTDVPADLATQAERCIRELERERF